MDTNTFAPHAPSLGASTPTLRRAGRGTATDHLKRGTGSMPVSGGGARERERRLRRQAKATQKASA